ncbi:MAG: FAD-dependent oxidoreductase [Saprospiraceae bacterium]
MRIVILGNGISGVTCARHLRKLSDHDITLVSDESDEFFSRTALMYIYMGHLRERDTRPYEPWFWEKNRIQRVRARIERIDFQEKKLFSTEGKDIAYDKLVLALGSKSNKFGWPGQDLDGAHGLYHLQDLAAMERASERMRNAESGMRNQQSTINNQQFRAVIVGGGLIGVEMAEMFHSRRIPVTFLVREKEFWDNILPSEEAKMVSRHLREHHIDLRLETELKEIQAAPSMTGSVGAVLTNKGETIPCGFVGLTVGVSPNIDFLKNTALEINKGILVDEQLKTNQPDVYAAGDCAELRQPPPGRRAIEAVWYTGRMMGETVAHNLIADCQLTIDSTTSNQQSTISNQQSTISNQQSAISNQQSTISNQQSTISNQQSAINNQQSAINNQQSYNPGVWFNSAKFFDIEYQVYGDIRARLPENQETVYWEHPDGKRSIRINYEQESSRVIGFNLMGIRYRHEVCDKWIRDGAHIETVLQNLGLANFDPEFSSQYEAEIVAIYNRRTGKNLTLKQKRGLPAVLDFLQRG